MPGTTTCTEAWGELDAKSGFSASGRWSSLVVGNQKKTDHTDRQSPVKLRKIFSSSVLKLVLCYRYDFVVVYLFYLLKMEELVSTVCKEQVGSFSRINGKLSSLQSQLHLRKSRLPFAKIPKGGQLSKAPKFERNLKDP